MATHHITNLTQREAVEILKPYFDGMRRSVFSMAMRPDYYGVCLTAKARALLGYFSDDSAHRVKKHRLVVRVNETLYSEFEHAKNGNTTQDVLTDALIFYLANRERMKKQ